MVYVSLVLHGGMVDAGESESRGESLGESRTWFKIKDLRWMRFEMHFA